MVLLHSERMNSLREVKIKPFGLNDLEMATIINSKSFLSLHESVGEGNLFENNKQILSDFVEMRSMNKALPDFFSKHNCKVMAEINKDERAYLRDMFQRLTKNKLYKKDFKLLKELSDNTINRGSHYFIILLSLIMKIFPQELVNRITNAISFGKRLSTILEEILGEKQVDDFIKLFLVEPFPIGFPYKDITLDNLHKYLAPYGFTPSLFYNTHKILIQNFTNRESNDIISLLENTEITDMDDLRNFPFSDFFRPTDETLSKLAKIIAKKASTEKKRLISKDRELDKSDINTREKTHETLRKHLTTLQSLIDKRSGDLHELLSDTQDLITNMEKTVKKHIRHIQGLEHTFRTLKSMVDENKASLNIGIGDIKSLLPSPPQWEIEKMVREYWHEIPYLTIINANCEKRIIHAIIKEEKLSEKKRVFSILGDESKRKFYPAVERVISNYKRIFANILEPLFIREVVDQMIEIWPPEVDFDNPKSRIINTQKIHLAGLSLLPRGKFYRFSRKSSIEPSVDKESLQKQEHISTYLRKQFSSLVSILVYDIRGSTFMAHRIRDAERERAILGKFQTSMLKAAKKGSSFIVKDTGDGGILWFGVNSKDLYHNMYKSREGKSSIILRSSIALEDEFSILPHPRCAEMAIRTALALVRAAEEFVRENYMNYRDWFEEITEKEVFHNGITYALLPPKFKSLFRLGIGIASGHPGKDVIFTPNAFGDPDLTGILVGESTIFSSGRSPERSVIIIDHGTFINLILNSDQLLITDPLTPEDSEQATLDKLLTILKMDEFEREFILNDFTISPVGVYYIDGKKEEKKIDFNIPEGLQLEFNEQGELVSGKSRVKILFEVLPREKNGE